MTIPTFPLLVRALKKKADPSFKWIALLIHVVFLFQVVLLKPKEAVR